MKILTYLPTFNKNQRNLEQILIDADYTSINCSRCGNKEKKKGEEFFCSKCRFTDNIHINAARILQKEQLNILKQLLSPRLLKGG
jgi:transposase